jgi:hypothetical protein
LTATTLVTPGGGLGLLFTFQDVTKIKKLERDALIQQRLAAVGEMAAGIAHESRDRFRFSARSCRSASSRNSSWTSSCANRSG